MAEREVLIRAEDVCPDCNKVHAIEATDQAAEKACARDWANFNPPRRDKAEEKIIKSVRIQLEFNFTLFATCPFSPTISHPRSGFA
jgi:hypothetical protein